MLLRFFAWPEENARAHSLAKGATYTNVMADENSPDAELRPTKVAIVVFEDVQALDVAGPMDVFAEANKFLPEERRYEVALVRLPSLDDRNSKTDLKKAAALGLKKRCECRMPSTNTSHLSS